MAENKITKILVELDGERLVHIRDLDKETYEKFLENMHLLRMAYITLQERKDVTDRKTI